MKTALSEPVRWSLVVYLGQIPILVAYELGVIPIHPIAIVLPLVGFLNDRIDRRGADGLGLRAVPRPGRSVFLVLICAALGLGGKLVALRLEGILLRAPTLTMGTVESVARDLAVDVLIIALWEEIVSRGYIQTRLQEAWGLPGLLVATLLFASLHVPSALQDCGWTSAALFRFVQALLGGLILGYVYWRTGSVLVTILLHGLRNFLTLSLIVHLSGIAGVEIQTSQIGFQLMWLLGEVGLTVLLSHVLFESSWAVARRLEWRLVRGSTGQRDREAIR